MTGQNLPKALLRLLALVQGKRARIVVDHILKHGFITTEELEIQYGYKHPPRAIRDVREQGIPLETFNVKNSEGRTIAAYRFAKLSDVQQGRIGGRKTFSKAFKNRLVEQGGERCAICSTPYESRYLQIDHRIPYAIAGDIEPNPDDFMLICGSCNRAKSWSCEHCRNMSELKDAALCRACYWTNPADYQHVALRPIRRLELIWLEEEVQTYSKIEHAAKHADESVSAYIKRILHNMFEADEE